MTKDTPGNAPLLLRLPPEIKKLLLRDAKKRRVTIQAVLLEIAANHYGVSVEPPRRGAQKKTTA